MGELNQNTHQKHKKHKKESEKERIERMEKEHRQFTEQFNTNNTNTNERKQNKRQRVNPIEEDKKRLEEYNAFAASFDQSLKKNKSRKRRREDMEYDNNEFEMGNRRNNKRHKS